MEKEKGREKEKLSFYSLLQREDDHVVRLAISLLNPRDLREMSSPFFSSWKKREREEEGDEEKR